MNILTFSEFMAAVNSEIGCRGAKTGTAFVSHLRADVKVKVPKTNPSGTSMLFSVSSYKVKAYLGFVAITASQNWKLLFLLTQIHIPLF